MNAVQHNSCVLSKVDPAANKRFFISDNKREIVLNFYTNQDSFHVGCEHLRLSDIPMMVSSFVTVSLYNACFLVMVDRI